MLFEGDNKSLWIWCHWYSNPNLEDPHMFVLDIRRLLNWQEQLQFTCYLIFFFHFWGGARSDFSHSDTEDAGSSHKRSRTVLQCRGREMIWSQPCPCTSGHRLYILFWGTTHTLCFENSRDQGNPLWSTSPVFRQPMILRKDGSVGLCACPRTPQPHNLPSNHPGWDGALQTLKHTTGLQTQGMQITQHAFF